jgi:hypothetical protein
MTQNPIRAEEYRARAAAETALSEAATLEQVRAKHDRAAKVWADLASAEDVRAADRARRVGVEDPALSVAD